MTTDLIYVFCLTDTPPRLQETMGSECLEALVLGDFHVVVKYVSPEEFLEENFKRNLSDIEWLDKNTREHVRVNGALSGQYNVIPFKFGTIFYNEDSLRRFIADYTMSLSENLSFIKGKEEWSVKIYCDRKSLSIQIDELSEESADLEKQIMASSPGKAYLLKRKKTELIEFEMDRICKKYGQEYFDEFIGVSTATSLNNLLPKEFTGREDNMILNASFLVNKNEVSNFRNKLDTLKNKYENSGFCIESTGPWTPYSFIHI
jgi:hypothetical protein